MASIASVWIGVSLAYVDASAGRAIGERCKRTEYNNHDWK
jgi:hypothetical protein